MQRMLTRNELDNAEQYIRTRETHILQFECLNIFVYLRSFYETVTRANEAANIAVNIEKTFQENRD